MLNIYLNPIFIKALEFRKQIIWSQFQAFNPCFPYVTAHFPLHLTHSLATTYSCQFIYIECTHARQYFTPSSLRPTLLDAFCDIQIKMSRPMNYELYHAAKTKFGQAGNKARNKPVHDAKDYTSRDNAQGIDVGITNPLPMAMAKRQWQWPQVQEMCADYNHNGRVWGWWWYWWYWWCTVDQVATICQRQLPHCVAVLDIFIWPWPAPHRPPLHPFPNRIQATWAALSI